MRRDDGLSELSLPYAWNGCSVNGVSSAPVSSQGRTIYRQRPRER
jgi:hypothetical protein